MSTIISQIKLEGEVRHIVQLSEEDLKVSLNIDSEEFGDVVLVEKNVN